MTIVLSTDLGTTKITALAVDVASGEAIARATSVNRAERTTAADKARGYSEWDAGVMAELALDCLRGVADQLGERCVEVAGMGITGQQHGVVVAGPDGESLTPFINWQDRRGEEATDGSAVSLVRRLQERAGADAAQRTGCRLATGYMAVSLCWLKEHGLLPAHGRACFIMDYFGSALTGAAPVTDPTCAASSGAFNVRQGDWDGELLDVLQLPRSLFVPLKGSADHLGRLTPSAAHRLGLRAGLPVFAGIGDNQASFLGSVARRQQSLLVNVGTGGQVAAFHADFEYDPSLETRPFPHGGFLLVSAGLSGGAAYAALERFYREAGRELFQYGEGNALYARMNELAARVPPGAGGLRCEPFFAGTRTEPELRGAWTGVSMINLTPAHFTRALLEGMARTFRTGADRILALLGEARPMLVGAGNGLRENALLARIIATELGHPLHVVRHAEEAAYGAALLAAVAAGVLPDLDAAGTLIRYADPVV